MWVMMVQHKTSDQYLTSGKVSTSSIHGFKRYRLVKTLTKSFNILSNADVDADADADASAYADAMVTAIALPVLSYSRVHKQISNYLVKRDYVKQIMQQYWVTKFNLSSSREYWSQVYTSFFNNLTNNKLIEFRFKLINSILPYKKLFKWRLSDNPLCEVYFIQENYHHMLKLYRMSCHSAVQIENSFRKCKFSNSLKRLQYLVVGYKSGKKKYVDLNYILPLTSYSIFKAYCLSENRKKYLDAVYLAKPEFHKAKRVSKSLKLSQNGLFNNFFEYFLRGKNIVKSSFRP